MIKNFKNSINIEAVEKKEENGSLNVEI